MKGKRVNKRRYRLTVGNDTQMMDIILAELRRRYLIFGYEFKLTLLMGSEAKVFKYRIIGYNMDISAYYEIREFIHGFSRGCIRQKEYSFHIH